MSGQKESVTNDVEDTSQQISKIQKVIKTIDQQLKNFVSSKGLINDETSYYIHLSQQQLNKLSPEQCNYGAYLITQSSLYIQTQINKNNAIINWANASIDFLISNKISQYGYKTTSYDQRRIMAIKDNSYTTELYSLIIKLKTQLNSISFIPYQLKDMSKALIELGNTKKSMK